MDEKQMVELGWRVGLFVLGTVAGAMAVGVARRRRPEVAAPRPKMVVLIGDPSLPELSAAVLGEVVVGNVLLGVASTTAGVGLLPVELRRMWGDFRKSLIEAADEVVVVNGGDALEGVARDELELAESMGKVVRWAAPTEDLEQLDQPLPEPDGGVDATFHVEPSAAGVSPSARCPKCGCQMLSPFGDGRVVHDVAACRGVVERTAP